MFCTLEVLCHYRVDVRFCIPWPQQPSREDVRERCFYFPTISKTPILSGNFIYDRENTVFFGFAILEVENILVLDRPEWCIRTEWGFRNGGGEEGDVTFMMLHREGDFLMFLSSSSLNGSLSLYPIFWVSGLWRIYVSYWLWNTNEKSWILFKKINSTKLSKGA
jgi:hypothetical protein